MTKDEKIHIILKYKEALDRAHNIVHDLEDLEWAPGALGPSNWPTGAMMGAERQLVQIREEANHIVSIVDSIISESEK